MERRERGNRIDQVSQTTVVAQVMARIKEMIADGSFGPGDQLPTEARLAEMFGVGRSSIREALKVFQHLGVVESKAAKGTFVRDRANISAEAITWALLLGEDDLADVFSLREAVEIVCFRRLVAALSIDAEEATSVVAELRAVVEQMYRAADDGRLNLLVDLDLDFHRLIVRAGDNRLFDALYETLHSFTHEEIRRSYRIVDSLREVAVDHDDILNVMESAPIEEAIERHRRHFARTRRLLGLAASPVWDADEEHTEEDLTDTV